jgi:hypothetical protein
MLENFHFNNDRKKIGVRVSGGADSAIIYYAVCNYYKNKEDVEIYPLTMDTELKWWYSTGAKVVIDKVSKLTGKFPTDWLICKNTKHKTILDREEYVNGINIMQKTAVEKYNLDAVYIGQTVNPPVAEMKNYFINNNHMLDVERLMDYIDTRDISRDTQEDLDIMTVNYNIGYSEISVKQIIPFANADKSSVKKLYDYYNMIEDLYSITYSCENVPETKTEPLVHCGHCFFCLERWWGFGRIK